MVGSLLFIACVCASEEVGDQSSAEGEPWRIVAQLEEKEAEARHRAIHLLSKLPQAEHKEVVPRLKGLLKAKSFETRVAAAAALVRMYPPPLEGAELTQSTLPILTRALLRSSGAVRQFVFEEIRHMEGISLAAALPSVLPPPRERALAVLAFLHLVSRLESPTTFVERELPALLVDEDVTVRRAAVPLSAACDPIVGLAICQAMMRDPDRLIRVATVVTAGMLTFHSTTREPASRLIVEGLTDEDDTVRGTAALQAHPQQGFGLAASGLSLKVKTTDVTKLRKAMRKSTLETQVMYLYVWETNAEIAAPAIPELIALLDATRDDPWIYLGVFEHVARILSKMGAGAKLAVPTLTKDLTHEKEAVRIQAAIALAHIDEKHYQRHYRTILAAAKGGPEALPIGEKLRVSALDALVKSAQPKNSALDILEKVFRDDWSEFRIAVVRSVGRFPQEPRAIALLHSALEDKDTSVRATAAEQLLQVPGSRERAIRELMSIFRQEGRVDAGRSVALKVLSTLDSNAGQTVPLFAQILESDDEHFATKVVAFHGLAHLGPSAADALPALNRILERGERGYLLEAFRTLGSIGPQAKDSIPLLIHHLTAGRPTVRVEAAKAIERITKSTIGSE
jgi:HEAT repeat protein